MMFFKENKIYLKINPYKITKKFCKKYSETVSELSKYDNKKRNIPCLNENDYSYMNAFVIKRFNKLIAVDNHELFPYSIMISDRIEHKNNYVELIEFLKNSKYIGKFAKRKQTNKTNFIGNKKIIILYIGDRNILALKKNKFILFDYRYVDDNWIFYENIKRNYSDIEEIYKLIEKQIFCITNNILKTY